MFLLAEALLSLVIIVGIPAVLIWLSISAPVQMLLLGALVLVGAILVKE